MVIFHSKVRYEYEKESLMSIIHACPINEVWLRLRMCILCISYEWNAKKSMIIKRDNLMCRSYEWGFMHSLNGMLRSYVIKERSLCLSLDARLRA